MHTGISLDDIRPCLEGAVPAMMATCDAEGVPNVAYLSQVEYVDGQHVALSYQFFNTTRRNVLANPRVEILVVHPLTAALYRIQARYLSTQTSGPLFERMKARLSGIASHTGMSGVFALRGADLYRVDAILHVPKEDVPMPPGGLARLSALRRCSDRLAACTDLGSLLETTLDCVGDEFGIDYAMLLMLDAPGRRLYTVASRGYTTSGVGSEIPLGQGVIGAAARERTPIRISHMTAEYTYSRAVRDSLARQGQAVALEMEIPWPGLAEPHSQLAVPVESSGRLLGVLFVESPEDLRFDYEDEDALVAIASHLGAVIELASGEAEEEEPRQEATAAATGKPLLVRHFASNHSVFLGDSYLIKGVAGAILCKLLRDHLDTGRTEFSNRELRLDTSLGLPEICDNLEARLLLLQRRLAEHGPALRIDKTGRGRFRLVLTRPVQLIDG